MKVTKSESLVVITGHTSGLGKALLDLVHSEKDLSCIGISRRKIFSHPSGNLTEIVANFSIPKEMLDACKKLVSYVHKSKIKFDNLYFFNNAASIEPINSIGTQNSETLIQSINTNFVTASVFINEIMKIEGHFKKLYFIDISSGAAVRTIHSWSAYCSAKAATKMLFKCLESESSRKSHVKIISIDPGVMDTNMQAIIRDKSQDEFPEVNAFIDFKTNSKLKKPQDVAAEILNNLNIVSSSR